MCLGIPGKILSRTDGFLPQGEVEVAGATRSVSLAYVPEAQVGDYVLISNGFAMDVIDEKSAKDSLATIAEFNLIDPHRLPQGRSPRAT